MEYCTEVIGCASRFGQCREYHRQSAYGTAAKECYHVNSEIGLTFVIRAYIADQRIYMAPDPGVVIAGGYSCVC